MRDKGHNQPNEFLWKPFSDFRRKFGLHCPTQAEAFVVFLGFLGFLGFYCFRAFLAFLAFRAFLDRITAEVEEENGDSLFPSVLLKDR